MKPSSLDKTIEEIQKKKHISLRRVVDILTQIKESRPGLFKNEIEHRIKTTASIKEKMTGVKGCNVGNIEKQ